MQRVRKYFRGSGRVLAFIFIASIIWLIFDMAALRFSFNEMNSKLNREELFKREQGGSESWKRRGNVHNGGHQWGEETTKLKGIFHPPADELGKVLNADPKVVNGDPKAVLKQRKRPMALNKTMAPMGKPRTELFDLNEGGVGKGNGLQAANITQELEAKAQAKENVIVRQKATGPVLRNAEVHNVEKPVEAVRLGDKKVGDAEDSEDAGAFRVMGGQDAAKSKDALVGKDGAAVNVAAKDAAESKDDAALHVQGVVKVVEASKQAGESLDPKHAGESRDAAEAKDGRPPEHAVVAKDVGDVKADIKAFKDALKVKDEGLAKVIVVAKDEEIVVKDKVADASKLVVKDKEVDTIKEAVKDKFADASKVVVKDKDVDTIKDAVKDEVADAGKVVVKDKDVDTIKDAVKDKVVEDSKVIVKDSDAAKVVEKDKNAEASKAIVQGKNDVDVKIAGKAVGGSKDEGPGLATLKLDKIKEQSLENQHPDKFLKDTIIAGKLNVTNDGPNPLPANNSSAVIINKVGAAIGNKSVNAKESLVQEPVQKLNRSDAGVGHVGESENQDVKGTLAKIIRDKQANVNISSSMNADVENKQLIHHDNLNRVPGTGMHKVRALDATVRDPKAPGQFGRPLAVPKDKEQEASRRWKEGNFNVYLSDIIPLDRAIEDTRPKGCSNQLIHDDLPSTSIIICFVDEVWSTLLRSVFSVLNRSPPELIKEIILVDDFSTKDYLKDNLDEYIKQYPKVRVLHLKERHGLIRARIAGANIATGDVLTFLDSHVECNVGWLEPLLEQVRVNRKKVACPVIEVISDKDMSYMTVDNFQRGIFSWPMNFGWKPIPTEVLQRNNITDMDPIKCPVMAGGLFSIDKKYFYELGTYDPGLDVWGGENMEISFKIWMCGGEIEIIPCSRVGHIFRNDNPYSFPKDRVKTVERNLARVAEVWLDDYKELFYGHGYHLLQEIKNIGDLTQQKELRKKLQCKSFKWYIDNVFPDLDAPLVRASGVIANVALDKCLALQNSNLILDACDASKVNQHFNFTWLRLIKQRDLCFAPGDKDKLALRQCDNLNSNLRWLHKSLTAFQPSLESHFVLESIPRPTCIEVDPTHKTLRTNACNPSNPLQKWQFEKYFAP